jgi:four helix bundle protein
MKEKVLSYKDLIVWQKSISLIKLIYALTSKFPTNETYILSAQLKKAGISISSNIAEGFGRRSSKEKQQFYLIAYGSALEIETQLYIANELKFVSQKGFTEAEAALLEIIKMLNKLAYPNTS